MPVDYVFMQLEIKYTAVLEISSAAPHMVMQNYSFPHHHLKCQHAYAYMYFLFEIHFSLD